MALVSCGAWAQTSPAAAPVTWPQALDAAWQRATERAAASGALARAEAEREAAARPWSGAPAIELDHRSGRVPGNGSARETEVGISWPLWMPGQRQARQDAADADGLAARLSADAARLRLLGELHERALEVAAQEAESRQAELEVRLMKALAEDVERRVRAGDLARADAMAARADLLQAQAGQGAALQRLQEARDRWQLLTGFAAVPAAPPPPPERLAGEHPEIAAAAARVERARRRLGVAERSRRDPPEVGVRVRRDTDSSGSANSIGVSLRVPFAADSRGLVQVAEARAELDAALLDEQRARDRVTLEVQAARLQVESAGQQLEAERSRAGLLRERAGLIDQSFRAGETALPELLRALAAAAQADASVVRQQAALQQAQARLSQSLGILP